MMDFTVFKAIVWTSEFGILTSRVLLSNGSFNFITKFDFL